MNGMRRIFLYCVMGIILALVTACYNPFLQEDDRGFRPESINDSDNGNNPGGGNGGGNGKNGDGSRDPLTPSFSLNKTKLDMCVLDEETLIATISSCRPAGITLPLVVRKIIALVSSTKRFSVIPLVSEFSLVSYTIAVGIRGKDTEITRNWLAVGRSVRPLLWSRNKGKYSLPHRYFARHVNDQPASMSTVCVTLMGEV